MFAPSDGRVVSPDSMTQGHLELVGRGAVLGGKRADVLVAIDHGEHQRRLLAGCGAVTDFWLLDTMMQLPLGTPVRLADLTPDERRDLENAPPGVVEQAAGHLVRVLQHPLDAVATIVRAQNWLTCRKALSPFRPAAQRIAVLSHRPAKLDEVMWDAQLNGVGLWIDHGHSDLEVLVPPTVPEIGVVQPISWQFREQIYQRWRQS